MKEIQGKPIIEYPCQWGYKVISKDHEKALQAIEQTIQTLTYEVTVSNTSKTGKYVSVHVELEVHSEEIRDSIFHGLKSHEDIIMVI